MLITVIATGIHCSLLKGKIMTLGKTWHSSVNGEKTETKDGWTARRMTRQQCLSLPIVGDEGAKMMKRAKQLCTRILAYEHLKSQPLWVDKILRVMASSHLPCTNGTDKS